VALLTSSHAGADAVGPPPKECPDGTKGESCHGGPYCDPNECTDSSKCGAGQTCAPVQYCTKQINCAGGWGKGPYYHTDVKGLCGSDGKCSSGTCSTLMVCADETPERGCSCDAAGGAGAGVLLGLVLVLAACVRRRV